jgi:hypothetical protein
VSVLVYGKTDGFVYLYLTNGQKDRTKGINKLTCVLKSPGGLTPVWLILVGYS